MYGLQLWWWYEYLFLNGGGMNNWHTISNCHTIYCIFHGSRLVAKTTQLESEKMQKETEVHKLMEENMRLTTLLDKKEAQLLAMNEQCKVMALSASNI